MFTDLNRVEIIGNITNDLNLRSTPSGVSVLSFGVATNRSYRPSGSDDWKEDTTFHNVVVWARQAEQLAQRAHKGTRLYLSGRLTTSTWEGQDGKKNYKTEIVADSISLIDRYEKGSSKDLPEPKFDNSAGGSSEKGSSKSKSPNSGSVIDPDDLPF